MTHPLAGQPAPQTSLTDIPALLAAYRNTPDVSQATQRVAFGTSGHRGSALHGSFNEAHILAIAQAVAEYRAGAGITGPLFLGMDTHALSAPAQQTTLEVLAANGVLTHLQADGGYTPTPVISRAILAHNTDKTVPRADGIVITPSHNPPQDGGIKYNPPHGGPADTDVTGWIEQRANALMADGNKDVKRMPYAQALAAPTTKAVDLMTPYIAALGEVIDMAAIKKANLRIGVDPMGGAAVAYWVPIAKHYGLNIEVVNPKVDGAFSFMTLDHDGKIRMDCSSPYAMASLVGLKDKFDIAWGNDADVDRHGIVTPSIGLMNPNHYLAVSINYLLTHRPQWPTAAAVGKTLVSSRTDRPRGEWPGPQVPRGAGRLQVVLGRVCSKAISASAVKKAPARASCASMARRGPPTRTASSSACWPPKSPPSPARTPAATIRNWPRNTARPTTSVSTHRPARRRRPPSSNSPARKSPPPRWPARRLPHA